MSCTGADAHLLYLGRDKITGADVGFATSVFDTGCHKYLGSNKFERLLTNKTSSKIVIQCAIGSQLTHGGFNGSVFMYFMSLAIGCTGGLYKADIDTAPNMTLNLMGYNQFHRDGYALHVPGADTDGGELSEACLFRDKHVLPLQYDPGLDFLVARTVVSSDAEAALRWGRKMEQQLQLITHGKAACGTARQVARASKTIHTYLSTLRTHPPNVTPASTVRFSASLLTTRGGGSSKFRQITSPSSSSHDIISTPSSSSDPTSSTTLTTVDPSSPKSTTTPAPPDQHFSKPPSAEQARATKVPLPDTITGVVPPSSHAMQLLEQNMPSIMGTKRGMSHKLRMMTTYQYHCRFGHMGHHPWCKVCMRNRGSFVRVYRNPTPKTAHLPGYCWTLDLIVWSEPSFDGTQYSGSMCDECTLTKLPGFHLSLRSGAQQMLVDIVQRMRKDPLFTDLPYPCVQVIRLDNAGEWSETNTAMRQTIEQVLGCRCIYTVTGDHRSAATIDAAVKSQEITTKNILLQSNLGPGWTSCAWDQAAQLSNRFPAAKNVGPDGTGVRPICQLAGNVKYTANMADRFLEYTLPVGTPCFVHNSSIKGSNNAEDKARWGVVKRQRVGDGALVFINPKYSFNVEFTSKNYHALELGDGMSYHDLIGCVKPLKSRACARDITERDKTLKYYVKIQNYQQLNHRPVTLRNLKRVTSVSPDGAPIIQIVDSTGRLLVTTDSGDIVGTTKFVRDASTPACPPEPELSDAPPTTNGMPPPEPAATPPLVITDQELTRYIDTDPDFFFQKTFYQHFPGYGHYEGTITAYDENNKLWLAKFADGDERTLTKRDMITFFVKRAQDPTMPNAHMVTTAATTYDCGNRGHRVHLIMCGAAGRATTHEYNNIIAHNGVDYFNAFSHQPVTLRYAAAALGVPDSLVPAYHFWLSSRGHEVAGGEDSVLPNGTKIPQPHGAAWGDITARHDELHGQHNTAWDEDTTARQLYSSMTEAVRARQLCLSAHSEYSELHNGSLDMYKDSSGKITNPSDWAKCQERADASRWLDCRKTEISEIKRQGTFSFGHTHESLRLAGIDAKPVNSRFVYELKWLGHEYKKHKARWVVCGHKYSMIKGVHYDAVYAAAPQDETIRIFLCLVVMYGYKEDQWDFKTAYLNGDLRDGEKIPIRAPREIRKKNSDGEELLMLLERNCYGIPQASRRWSEKRNKVTLKELNGNGWTTVKSDSDPCLFIITSPSGGKTFLSTHVDDTRSCYQLDEDNAYVKAAIRKHFEITEEEPKEHLSVEITHTTVKGIKFVHLTQTSYICEIYAAFKQHLPRRRSTTPFPSKLKLSIATASLRPESEHKAVHTRGYLSVVGMLLWVYRRTMPQLCAGIQMLTRVMSKPTEEAWKAAMHMVSYVYEQRLVGIVYRGDAEKKVRIYYDASNDPDPNDQKALFSVIVYFGNAPILWYGKKNAHEGMSSTHDEVQALKEAAQIAVHVQKLFEDMGFDPEILTMPIPVLGDNRQCIKWSREDYVTPGNRYYARDLRFIKRRVEDGTICTRFIPGKDNYADIGTKPQELADYKRLINGLRGNGDLLPDLPPPPAT